MGELEGLEDREFCEALSSVGDVFGVIGLPEKDLDTHTQRHEIGGD